VEGEVIAEQEDGGPGGQDERGVDLCEYICVSFSFRFWGLIFLEDLI
jgi:hypothetical protein